MTSFMEGMTRPAARVSQLGDGSKQRVANRNDGCCLDRFFKPKAALISPLGDECPVTKLADGHRCQEDLMPCHEPNEGLETRAPASTE